MIFYDLIIKEISMNRVYNKYYMLFILLVSGSMGILAQEASTVKAVADIFEDVGDVGEAWAETAKSPSFSFDNVSLDNLTATATASVGDIQLLNWNIKKGEIIQNCKGRAQCNASINMQEERGVASVGEMYDWKLTEEAINIGTVSMLAHVNPEFSPTNRILRYSYMLDNGSKYEVLFVLLPINKRMKGVSRRMDNRLRQLKAEDATTNSVFAVFTRPMGQTLWKMNAELPFANKVDNTAGFIKEVGIEPNGNLFVIFGSFKDENGKIINALSIDIAL